MLATCVRPFCSSRISVLVGLPLTTNVPVSAAAMLAPLSPTNVAVDVDALTVLRAKLREVAALCATMRTKHEKAMPITLGTSPQAMPWGRPTGGKPPCTAPTIATP